MKLIDHIYEQGLPPKNSEDSWGVTETAAWVLDGATGLSKKQFVANEGQTDPRWLMDTATELLKSYADEIDDIAAIYDRVLNDCEQAYTKALGGEEIDKGFRASGASLIIKQNGHTVTCGALSDCTLLIETADGIDIMPPCPIHAAVDDYAKAEMKKVLDAGGTHAEARASIADILMDQRRKLNTPEGHYNFVPDASVLPHVRYGKFTVESGAHALLMSDGFYALVEDYHVYDDAGLMRAAKGDGLAHLYKELRQIENDDPEGRKYIRTKKSDDATAVLVAL